MTNLPELSGTAVVTGGGRGIGAAMGEALARAGMSVVLVSRSAVEIDAVAGRIREAGGQARSITADVSDADRMVALAKETGPVDLLVNNAGIFNAVGPVWDVDPKAWLNDITVNIFGVFASARAFLPAMLERKEGRMINLAGGGTDSPIKYGSGYASSKAAVMRLTECLHQELEGTGVRSFALDPGLVLTRMNANHMSRPEGQKWFADLKHAFKRGDDVEPTLAAEMTVRIASGQLDRMAGHLIQARDDAALLLERQEQIVSEKRRLLRVLDNAPLTE